MKMMMTPRLPLKTTKRWNCMNDWVSYLRFLVVLVLSLSFFQSEILLVSSLHVSSRPTKTRTRTTTTKTSKFPPYRSALFYKNNKNNHHHHLSPSSSKRYRSSSVFPLHAAIRGGGGGGSTNAVIAAAAIAESATNKSLLSVVLAKVVNGIRSLTPPSKATILATVLAFLLAREWWSKLPPWILQGFASIFLRRKKKKKKMGKATTIKSSSPKSKTKMEAAVNTTKDEGEKTTTKDDKPRFQLPFNIDLKGKGSKEEEEVVVYDDDDEDEDDVDGPMATVRKLQSVLSLASEKFAENSNDSIRQLEGFQLQMAILTTLKLVQQTKETKSSSELWDTYHQTSGTPVPKLSLEDETELIKQLRMTDWAYLTETKEIRDNLRNVDYTLVRHVKTDEPGRVGHYIAINEQEKVAVIVVKGTSALSDMVTDACGTPVRYELPDGPYSDDNDNNNKNQNGPTIISCHEGILDSSLDLADDIQPLVEHLFLPSGFRILITGHSLGAGVASVVGALLRSRMPELKLKAGNFNNNNKNKNNNKLLQVLAFAPPPTLNLEAALATSSFTRTVVNNLDVVPRASINNAVALLRFMDYVYSKLEEKEMAPTNPMAAFELMKALVSGDKDATMIMTTEELFQGLTETQEDEDLYDMDHLYIPGKVLFVYDKLSSTVGTESNNATESIVAGIETDGASPALRHVNLDKRMLSDHFPVAYEATITAKWDDP